MKTEQQYKKEFKTYKKQYKVENTNAQKKNEELAEKYDIKKMTVNAMEAYLASLDDKYRKVKVSIQSSMKNENEYQKLQQQSLNQKVILSM